MPIFRRHRDVHAGPHLARGVITLVQEDRCTLRCDDGSCRLFLLAHDCPTELPDLEEAMRREFRLAIACDQAEDVVAALACRIYRTDDCAGAG